MPTHSRFMVCQKVLRNRCSAEADQGAGQGSMESPPPHFMATHWGSVLRQALGESRQGSRGRRDI